MQIAEFCAMDFLKGTKTALLNTPLRDIGLKDFPESVKVQHLVSVLEQVPKPLPTWHHLIYDKPFNDLQPGDIIVINSSLGLQSYAIVSNTDPGAGQVICFANEQGQPVFDVAAFVATLVQHQEICLRKIHIASFKSEHFTVVKQNNKKETLFRALKLLNGQFSFLKFNSEHFATKCFMGEEKSHQIENMKRHIKKHVISGALGTAFTKEGRKIIHQSVAVLPEIWGAANQGAKKVVDEGMKKVAKEGAKEGTKEVIKEAAESTFTEGSKKFVKECSKSVAKETVEETVTTAAKLANRFKDGAKSGLGGAVLVESIFLSYKIVQSYKQYNKGEIDGVQFHHQCVRDVGSSGGSVGVGALGAGIGSVIFPVVGTFIGGVAGGMLGSILGAKASVALVYTWW